MSEAAVKPVPRRGRFLILAIIALIVFGTSYLVVEVATQEPSEDLIRLQGGEEMQRTFGGVRQEGERLGFSDAPVTIQVFNDVQCQACRDDFLETIPPLVEDYGRSGEAQFLWRNYSNSENPQQLGFYGAEAAAEQDYLWQYVYLFFRNQGEAPEGRIDQEFLEAIAAGIPELDMAQWEADLEEKGGPDGPIARRLEESEELARDLEIRLGQGMVVTGPNGNVVLQEGPSLAEVEAAIAEVE
jgi:protein-disulfide isomerase